MTNGERYIENHPGYDWDVYDDDDYGDYVMTRSDNGTGADGDTFDASWWFREEGKE